MSIRAYTFMADMHCVACTRAASETGALRRDSSHPHAAPGYDENGVRMDLVDREGNVIHPVFGWDEVPEEGEYCGDCGAEISARYIEGELPDA